MTLTHPFAYTQARLQSRHGERPDEAVWRQLEAQRSLANFLQAARHTSLRPWVQGLHANDPWHLLEYTLMMQLHHTIDSVAGWQPSEWRAATRWVRQLLYLPAIQFLLAGNTAYRWMLQDSYLKEFAVSNISQRIQAMQASPSAPLLSGWESQTSLLDAWLSYWHSLWPKSNDRWRQALEYFSTLLSKHLEKFIHLQAEQPAQLAWRERVALEKKLSLLFRRYTEQPVSAFIHLALVALDVERLRGNIMQRAVFPELQGETA